MAETKDTTATGEVRDFDFENTRGLRYVELFGRRAGVDHRLQLDRAERGPPELWDALDEKAAAEQLGVGTVLKNGPHWWMSDKATFEAEGA